MIGTLTPPGGLDGEILAILVLFSFHCRVQLPDGAHRLRKALLLFLTDKVYQETPPSASLSHFVDELKGALGQDMEESKIALDYLENMMSLLDVPDGLTKLFNEHFSRILPSYESLGVINTSEVFFERRSFFGLFFRRMKLTFDSLDLQARNLLTSSAQAWRKGALDDTAQPLNNLNESSQDARLLAFQKYQLGLLRGDYTLAKENMERFFDFFPPGADHEVHQHTLLHLAAFHLQSDSFVAARAALDEAISLARSAGDQECILACESLMDRIKGVGSSTVSHRGQNTVEDGDNHPHIVDAVWKAQCDATKGTPLISVIQTLNDAASPAGPSRELLSTMEVSLELMEDAKKRFGYDAITENSELARLWDRAGQDALMRVYQSQATLQTHETGSARWEETRLDSICHKCNRLAKQGKYDVALTLLLLPATYRCLSFREYRSWCDAIGDVLWLRATRRDETHTLRLLRRCLPRHRDPSQSVDIEELVDAPKTLIDMALQQIETGSTSTSSDPILQRFQELAHLTSEEQVESLLKEARKHIDGSQPSLALMPILSSLATAKELDYGSLLQAAQVLLAEVLGLHLGMPERGRMLLEQYLPSCLTSDDMEHRAYSQWTYSRLLLACSKAKTDTELKRCLRWMAQAEQDAEQAGCIGLQKVILYYMARLHHHMDDSATREEVATKQLAVEREWIRATESVCQNSLDEVEKVLEIVSSVGAYVASGMAATARSSVTYA